MSKLYEINQQIAELADRCEWDGEQFIDLETGEIMTEEQYTDLFAELQMSKQEILEWMAKQTISDRAEAESIKAEIARLTDRMNKFKKRAERLESIIIRECDGKKTNLGVADVTFRKSEATEVSEDMKPQIIEWLEKNGHDDCLNYKAPEIRKTELKTLIKSGVTVPGCKVVDRLNGKLK